MARTKKPVEAVRGRYAALPWAVMDSPAYCGASPTAKALLTELIRQHNGANNGRLHLSRKWLEPRGWLSRSIVDKARAELIQRGLILETKQGGLFVGATWHALTWLPITNHVGLETAPNTYHPGGWQCCDLPPTARRKPPMKKISQPVHRDSAVPTTGTVSPAAVPYTGTVEAISGGFPVPYTGHDVLLPLPPAENLSAVQRFQTRIGGNLSTPKREPNPLGRTRNLKLFQAAYGPMIRNPEPGKPAERYPAIRALLASVPGSASPTVDRRFPRVRALLPVATPANSGHRFH